jgi:hypothetical protein
MGFGLPLLEPEAVMATEAAEPSWQGPLRSVHPV